MSQTPNEFAEQERLRQERTKVLQRFFSSVTVPDIENVSANGVLGLLDQPAFATLVGLMNGYRNTLMVQLSNVPLDTPAAIAQASVLQGRVQGIDSLYSTLLEVVNQQPSPASETQR